MSIISHYNSSGSQSADNNTALNFVDQATVYTTEDRTESPEMKTKMILESLEGEINEAKVVSIVGADWPLFYSDLDVAEGSFIDINIIQLQSFQQRFLNGEDSDLTEKFKSRFKLIHGDMTSQEPWLSELISNADIVDLSNILDYIKDQDLILETIQWYVSNMKPGAILLMGSLYSTIQNLIDMHFNYKYVKSYFSPVANDSDVSFYSVIKAPGN